MKTRSVAILVASVLVLHGAQPADAAPPINLQWLAASATFPNSLCELTLQDNAAEDPVLAGGVLTLTTTVPANGMYYEQTAADLAIPDSLVIEARVRFVINSTTSVVRSGVGVAFCTQPNRWNILQLGADEAYLLQGTSATRGLTANVDTDDAFHLYRIEVIVSTGAIEVRQDGIQILTGSLLTSTESPSPVLWFGDGSSNPSATSEWTSFGHNADKPGCGGVVAAATRTWGETKALYR